MKNKIILCTAILTAFLMLMIPNISAVNAQNTNDVIEEPRDFFKTGTILNLFLSLVDVFLGFGATIFGLLDGVTVLSLLGLFTIIGGLFSWTINKYDEN